MDFTGSEPIDLRNSNRQTFDLNFRFQEAYVDGSRKCWLYAYRKQIHTWYCQV